MLIFASSSIPTIPMLQDGGSSSNTLNPKPYSSALLQGNRLPGRGNATLRQDVQASPASWLATAQLAIKWGPQNKTKYYNPCAGDPKNQNRFGKPMSRYVNISCACIYIYARICIYIYICLLNCLFVPIYSSKTPYNPCIPCKGISFLGKAHMSYSLKS